MNSKSCAGLSDPGQRREQNEDRWLADPALGLYAVADGLGGAAGGEEAAQWVADALPPLVRKHLRGIRDLADQRASDRLREVLAILNGQLYDQSQKHSFMSGMGAAVICALVWERQVLVAHLGDCRAYVFHQGTIEQITRDHSTVQALIDQGRITVKQAAYHPSLGRLTRYVGCGTQVEAETSFRTLSPGDRLLLCSDGLFSELSDDEMAGILHLRRPAAETCSLLVDAANLHGGDDNITAVVVCL